MARQPFTNNRNLEGIDSLAHIQNLFLATLTQTEAEVYPWELALIGTEDYFLAQEQEFALDTILEAGELGIRTESLFANLGQCWQSVSQWETIKQGLSDRFRGVPTAWLDAIATAAQEVSQQRYSLQDKLVSCVHTLLAQWSEEDLQVLARPLAYAMRGNTPEEQTLTGVWENLSPVEQARWRLAIAKAALQEMERAD